MNKTACNDVRCCGEIDGRLVVTVSALADSPIAVSRSDAGVAKDARLFRALGDETRLTIIQQLRQCEEICACDFVACCDLAQPTVSHHLKVLREVEVVLTTKRGLWVYYRLNPGALVSLGQYLP